MRGNLEHSRLPIHFLAFDSQASRQVQKIVRVHLDGREEQKKANFACVLGMYKFNNEFRQPNFRTMLWFDKGVKKFRKKQIALKGRF